MRIIGIDPGTNATGYAFIEFVDQRIKVLEAGTITPKAGQPLHERIHKIYASLHDLIGQYGPEVMVLEKLYAHHKFPTTAGILGHVRGVICLLCAERKMKLVEHSVKRIRKAVAGNGNATKKQTQMSVCHILGIDPGKLTLDASDALALAYGYTQMQGRGL